jgi:hypothetical protein
MPTEETKCEFYRWGWNDDEQKNYTIYECENPDNVGGHPSCSGDDGRFLDIDHSSRMYSCWYKNKEMKFRCFGNPEKMKECPLVKLINSAS